MMDLSIAKPLTLACGLTLSNRLVKAAMAEGLGQKDAQNLPGGKECLDAYGEWAKGGWGTIITGNVQIDPSHLGGPEDFAIDLSLDLSRTLAAYKAWAHASSHNNTKAVVQLCHPGRQIAFHKGPTIAPSAVPIDLGSAPIPRLLNKLVFGTPREMTFEEIQDVISKFARAARVVADAGFAGVELHAAHGYLLTQFLSPVSNLRTDDYGGSAAARAKIVVEIVQAIRRVVPSTFCVGLKVNSVDVGNKAAMEESIAQLQHIAGSGGVDFLEISGGSFENPTFSTGLGDEKAKGDRTSNNGGVKASTAAREAFFFDFSSAVRQALPSVPLLLTGGFRSRAGMEAALKAGCCDLVGLARPSVLDPLLPRRVLLNPDVEDGEAVAYAKKIPEGTLAKKLGVKLIGVGTERDWYVGNMHRIGAVKTSTVITAADGKTGASVLRQFLSQRDLAKSRYGLYLAENISVAEDVLAKVDPALHTYETMNLHGSSLTSVRETAGNINKHVAAGFVPPIQALLLTEERNQAANLLLCLLLLQSMDKDCGRIIVVASRSKYASVPLSDEKSELLNGGVHSHKTRSLFLELTSRLADDPALSNISVAVVDSDVDSAKARKTEAWFLFELTGRIFWLLSAVLTFLLSGGTKSDPTARDVVLAVADDRNGLHLCALALSESDMMTDKAERGRVWRDALVQAGVKEVDTVLSNWR
ncbi:FMN-linked oxidoreductase [Colletotrichum somersetense]|nr:FMN-linked oxidoreductase [Colletotrichum somersetense]